MTATHAIVRSQTRRLERVGHRLFIDNFFSSPDFLDDLHTRDINCYRTVRQNCKGMPRCFDSRILKLKWGDTHARVRGKLSALVWKDRKDVHILTSIHRPSTEGNLSDEHERIQTTFITWVTLTQGTEWLIAIHLVRKNGNGHKNYFSTSWI
jgi:hypothetical protein